MTRLWGRRILVSLLFVTLTILSVTFELFEWRIETHRRLYTIFFGVAGIALLIALTTLLSSGSSTSM